MDDGEREAFDDDVGVEVDSIDVVARDEQDGALTVTTEMKPPFEAPACDCTCVVTKNIDRVAEGEVGARIETKIIGEEERHAAREAVREVVDVDEKEERAENGALRHAASDRIPTACHTALHDAKAASREKGAYPTPGTTVYVRLIEQLVEQPIVPNRVERFHKIEKNDWQKLIVANTMVRTMQKHEQAIIRRKMGTKTTLQEIEKLTLLKKQNKTRMNHVLTQTCNDRRECNDAVRVAILRVRPMSLEEREAIGRSPVIGQHAEHIRKIKQQNKRRQERIARMRDKRWHKLLWVLRRAARDLLESRPQVVDGERRVEVWTCGLLTAAGRDE